LIKMTEIIEKALTTVVALLIVVSTCFPTINFGTSVISDGCKLTLVNDLLNKLDFGVKQAKLGGTFYVAKGYFPDNLRIWSQGSSIVVEYYAFGQWNVERRVYSTLINVNCPEQPGPCQIIIFKQESVINVDFRGE